MSSSSTDSTILWVFLYLSTQSSLVVQVVKNPLAMQETQVWALGWEDPQEKWMAIHASTLAWRIPWTEEPGGLHTVHGVAESGTTEWLPHFRFSFACPLWFHIPSSSSTISTSLWQDFSAIQPLRLILCLPPVSLRLSLPTHQLWLLSASARE